MKVEKGAARGMLGLFGFFVFSFNERGRRGWGKRDCRWMTGASDLQARAMTGRGMEARWAAGLAENWGWKLTAAEADYRLG